MSDSALVLGPYVRRRTDGKRLSEHVADTGCILEFATQAEAHVLNIFHCPGHFPESRDFGTYAVREIQIPFGIQCFGFQVKDYAEGPYVTLSAFLAGMYALYERLTPIHRFFEDFAEALLIEDAFFDSADASVYPLKRDIEAMGYRVRSVMCWGRRIDLEIAWVFPQSPQGNADAPVPTCSNCAIPAKARSDSR